MIASEYVPFLADAQTTQSRLSGPRHAAAGAVCDRPSLIHLPRVVRAGIRGLAPAVVFATLASSKQELATTRAMPATPRDCDLRTLAPNVGRWPAAAGPLVLLSMYLDTFQTEPYRVSGGPHSKDKSEGRTLASGKSLQLRG